MLYDKKEGIEKFEKNPSYPINVVNCKKQEKVCNDKEELFNHLICRDEKEMNVIGQIVGGFYITKIKDETITRQFHPEIFIEEDVYKLLSLYSQMKRYGIQFFYPTWNDIPAYVLEAFDLIQNICDKDESNKLKTQQSKSESELKKNKK